MSHKCYTTLYSYTCVMCFCKCILYSFCSELLLMRFVHESGNGYIFHNTTNNKICLQGIQ